MAIRMSECIDLLREVTSDIYHPRVNGCVNWSNVMHGHRLEDPNSMVGIINHGLTEHAVISKRDILRSGSARELVNLVREKLADAALRQFKAVREALGLPEYREYVVHKMVGKVTRRPYAKSRSGRYRL